MEIVYLVVALVALDFAALRWGADSRDGLSSPEWRRRLGWHPGSHNNK